MLPKTAGPFPAGPAGAFQDFGKLLASNGRTFSSRIKEKKLRQIDNFLPHHLEKAGIGDELGNQSRFTDHRLLHSSTEPVRNPYNP